MQSELSDDINTKQAVIIFADLSLLVKSTNKKSVLS